MEKYALMMVGMVAVVAIVSVILVTTTNMQFSTTGNALAPATLTQDPAVQTVTCYDSDGKNNWFTKGYVDYKNNRYTDYCGGNTVYDYYCLDIVEAKEPVATAYVVQSPNPAPSAPKTSFACNFGCCDGACKQNASTCTETDGGNDPYVRGITAGWSSMCPANESSSFYFQDYCTNANTVREYFCAFQTTINGTLTYNYVDRSCPNGCSNGACLQPSNASVCGNGRKEGNEQCDAGSQNGVACTVPYSLVPGESSCTYCSLTCQNVIVQNEYCGDSIVNTQYEECDLANLNGKTCSSLGYTGGTLSCRNLTCRFIVTGCTNTSTDTTNPSVNFDIYSNGPNAVYMYASGFDSGSGMYFMYLYDINLEINNTNTSFPPYNQSCGGSNLCILNKTFSGNGLWTARLYSRDMAGNRDDQYKSYYN